MSLPVVLGASSLVAANVIGMFPSQEAAALGLGPMRSYAVGLRFWPGLSRPKA